MRTSPFRSAAYSLRYKTKKFEAILFPRRSRRRCLHTADRRALVPEAAAVHPKCAKSINGAHARPSRAKADTPRCSTSRRCRTTATHDPPHVPLRGVIGGGTAIVSVEQDGV
jgi:hypothetical protein